MTLLSRARPAGEKGEALIQPGVELVGGHGPQAGGGELDGQRHAVEPPADAGDDACGLPLKQEPGIVLARSLGEQAQGLTREYRVHSGVLSGGMQGRDPVDVLTFDSERLA